MNQSLDEDILSRCTQAQAAAIRSYLEMGVGWSIHEVQKKTGVVFLTRNLMSYVSVSRSGNASLIS